MKREFLAAYGLTDEQISEVLNENGKDIQRYKSSAEKFESELEAANTTIGELRTTLDDRKKDAEALRAQLDTAGMNAEELQNLRDELARKENEYQQQLEAMEQKVENERYSMLVDSFLESVPFAGELARKAVRAELMNEESKLAVQDGKLKGADEFIAKIRETDPSSFKDEASKEEGAQSVTGAGGNEPAPAPLPGTEPTNGVGAFPPLPNGDEARKPMFTTGRKGTGNTLAPEEGAPDAKAIIDQWGFSSVRAPEPK